LSVEESVPAPAPRAAFVHTGQFVEKRVVLPVLSALVAVAAVPTIAAHLLPGPCAVVEGCLLGPIRPLLLLVVTSAVIVGPLMSDFGD
jgi:hypothetical protein